MKNFAINTKRDLLIPDFSCYQMNISGPVNAAIKAGEVSDDFKELPSWRKFSANPMKSKGFFVRVLESVFKGTGGHDELNVDSMIHSSGPRVAMIFINAHNIQMEMIDQIANQSLDAYRVVTLSGGVKYKGKKVTQNNCQQIAREVVEQATKDNKSVLIISNIMGQRSFSVPEITELYLAYDGGEMGATLQKMSRTLTPGDIDKTGRIFSLSFDPNRDDKFDAMIIETAINIKKRKNIRSLAEALRTVLSTIDIFACTKDGVISMDKDTYLASALARNSVSRVIGKTINMPTDPEILSAIAKGNSDYLRGEKQEQTASGKTRDKKTTRKQGSNNTDKSDAASKTLVENARKVVVAILENLDVIIEGTDCNILTDAMDIIRTDVSYQECVEEEFGVGYEVIAYLFDNNIIKQEHAELMFDMA